ncbi:MAG: ABC transporter substrate-binding protein [Oscillospiraceae bacterium]|nr:ABC transporter substrate-binding protein [Oscillospiraceae bacterium]
MNIKRKISGILTLAMLLSLTACDGNPTAENTAIPTESAGVTDTVQADSSDEPSAEESAKAEEQQRQEAEKEEQERQKAEQEQQAAARETAEWQKDLIATSNTFPEEYSFASLKGPTTMGMVKMMSDSEKGETFNKYNVSIYGAADEIVAGVVSGSTDIANVPANLAAVLYNKTEGNICVCDVNTLGVLYIVAINEEINSIEDLRGKTVYSTGKGTTPEYVLNYILRQNGLEPQTDVTIEYKTEASECAAVMAESESGIAVLPQPYVTAAMKQNDAIQIWLSLTDEWNKVSDTPLITGVTIAQKKAVSRNWGAFHIFLDEYAASVDYVNANNDEAAALIGGYDIIAEPVAKVALPLCNITLLRDDEMINAVNGYWNVLFEADPTAVGGTVPDREAFYTSAFADGNE